MARVPIIRYLTFQFATDMSVPLSNWTIALGPLGEYMLKENSALVEENAKLARAMQDQEHRHHLEMTEMMTLNENYVMQATNFRNYATNMERQLRKVIAKLNRQRMKRLQACRLLRALSTRHGRLASIIRANSTIMVRDIPDSPIEALETSTEEEDSDIELED